MGEWLRSIFQLFLRHVAGAYCIYDNDNNKIMFCAPEEYAMNVGPSDPSTCQSQWTFPPTPSPTPTPAIPSSVILSIPDGNLTDFFLPSPPGNPFQRNESYHCFEIDSLTTGYPNYVSGVAQGFGTSRARSLTAS